MEKVYLDNFIHDIENIREYIKHIELVNEIEQNNVGKKKEKSLETFLKHFDKFKKEKNRFEHRAIIISLYGILENHINLWVEEHINNIPIILKYDSLLSSKIIDSNFTLSIELISTILKQKNNPKYEDMDKERILKKLNSTTFELNSEAFISNSGNLTHQKIIELFSPLEIDAKKINENDVIKKRKSNIDTLILLRNEISHGTKIANTLIEFAVYIDSLEDYGKALFSILEKKEEEYQLKYEMKYKFHEIKTVHKIINNSILLCKIEDNSISIGDDIINKGKDGKVYKNKILSIEVNGDKKENLITKTNIDVGLELETISNLKVNQTFYIKKRENQ